MVCPKGEKMAQRRRHPVNKNYLFSKIILTQKLKVESGFEWSVVGGYHHFDVYTRRRVLAKEKK